MHTKILYLFTRTPLHVGAGASVGAIDQPIQRERHTGFPIIPGSSLKGSFADAWNDGLKDEEPDSQGKVSRVRVTKKGEHAEAAWLFGSDNDKSAYAGSLLFSEARVLAFPIRSAKGSFAWITCPMMLQHAARDGVITVKIPNEPNDDQATFKTNGPLALDVNGIKQIVLEEYCFKHSNDSSPDLGETLADLVADDIWKHVKDRLVILSNGMMSHFVSTTCEIAQHVHINDETGTADDGGLFNQENVPADTLFYSVLNATAGRGEFFKVKTAAEALNSFAAKVKAANDVFQFGGDASTGLGFCTVTINEKKGA